MDTPERATEEALLHDIQSHDRRALGQLAPLALRQILEHEWTHFAFEVAGTEVEDVLDRLVYPGYVLRRFGPPRTAWSQGPLEDWDIA